MYPHMSAGFLVKKQSYTWYEFSVPLKNQQTSTCSDFGEGATSNRENQQKVDFM